MFVDAGEAACRLIKENLKRTRLDTQGRVVRSDYLDYLEHCKDKFDIIFLDPPYAEVYLETSLNRILEIDILQTNGIIVTERPLGKELIFSVEGLDRSRDHKYSKTLVTIFRKR